MLGLAIDRLDAEGVFPMRRELNWVLAAAVLGGACGREAPKASDASPSTRTEVCTTATEPEIRALFDRWISTLQTGDSRKVVANYAERSILLPTLSNTP